MAPESTKRIGLLLIALLLTFSLPLLGCGECNDADTIKRNIIHAMKARAAAKRAAREAEANAGSTAPVSGPSKSLGSQLDEGYFKPGAPDESPAPSYRRPRAVTEDY